MEAERLVLVWSLSEEQNLSHSFLISTSVLFLISLLFLIFVFTGRKQFPLPKLCKDVKKSHPGAGIMLSISILDIISLCIYGTESVIFSNAFFFITCTSSLEISGRVFNMTPIKTSPQRDEGSGGDLGSVTSKFPAAPIFAFSPGI